MLRYMDYGSFCLKKRVNRCFYLRKFRELVIISITLSALAVAKVECVIVVKELWF